MFKHDESREVFTNPQSEQARKHRMIFATLTTEYRSEYNRGLFAEGAAKAAVVVLEARGLRVTEEERARITGCNDLDEIEFWLRRATKVNAVSELFD